MGDAACLFYLRFGGVLPTIQGIHEVQGWQNQMDRASPILAQNHPHCCPRGPDIRICRLKQDAPLYGPADAGEPLAHNLLRRQVKIKEEHNLQSGESEEGYFGR
jgi:hypothetical protein